MGKVYYSSEKNREALSQIYKNLTGKKLKPPDREVHLEDTQELEKLMQESPNYPIEAQGRK